MSKTAYDFLKEWHRFMRPEKNKFRTNVMNRRWTIVDLSTNTLRNLGEHNTEEIRNIHQLAPTLAAKPSRKNWHWIEKHKVMLVGSWRPTETIFKELQIDISRKTGERRRGHVVSVVESDFAEAYHATRYTAEKLDVPSNITDFIDKQYKEFVEKTEVTISADLLRKVNAITGLTERHEYAVITSQIPKENITKQEERQYRELIGKKFEQYISSSEVMETIWNNLMNPDLESSIDSVLNYSLNGKVIGKNKKKKSITKRRKMSKKDSAKLGRPIPKTRKQPIPKNISGRDISPITVQNILNANISARVVHNMGDPALNYRTGRFSNSVEVQRVTLTRGGRITAFYNYMKNPYQTFERGFAQGSFSRDPRRLISKSIREIASELFGDRFDIKTYRSRA